MLKRLIQSVIPRSIAYTLSNYKILSGYYGQYTSLARGECVDRAGAPIPWYTYPATEYIKQLDLSEKVVFEFGSGNSTRFWAGRCKKLVSVEDNLDWYEKVRSLLPSDVEYQLFADQEQYVSSIEKWQHDFDVIIVDGSHRYECAVHAIVKLKDDGFIILDNSDWNERASALLRQADLIEVDMAGFGPLNYYTWVTSFYFRRNVKLNPAYDRQPIRPTGGIPPANCPG